MNTAAATAISLHHEVEDLEASLQVLDSQIARGGPLAARRQERRAEKARILDLKVQEFLAAEKAAGIRLGGLLPSPAIDAAR